MTARALVAGLALIALPLSAQNYREVSDDPRPSAFLGLNLQLGFPQGVF